MDNFKLVFEAMQARKNAYIPYSNHGVGAALLAKDGTVFRGCNIESASYTPTNCAERTAFFKAVSEGYKDFEKIAIVGGMSDQDELDLCAPCGVCRQVMMEFTDPKTFTIVLAKIKNALDPDQLTEDDIEIQEFTLEEMLPLGFGPINMGL